MKIATLITAIIVFTTISCENRADDNTETVKLNDQISFLKAQNKKLQDSIDVLEENFLTSQILIGIPDDEILTVGRKNRIAMLFQTFDKQLPSYEVFKIDGDKQTKLGDGNNTRYNFDHTPKSLSDTELKMTVKMSFKDKIIEYPFHITYRVKK